MILKDDVVLLRDFKREDIAKRIEWETEKTEWQLWDAPWEYEGLTEEQIRREAKRCLHCGQSVVDTDKCIGCGMCERVCAGSAITRTVEKLEEGDRITLTFNLGSCTFCATCADFCSTKAIEFTGDYHMIATKEEDLLVTGSFIKKPPVKKAAPAPAAAAPAPTAAAAEQMDGDTVEKLSGMRKVVAQRMQQSHTEIPPVTQVTKVDVTALMQFRRELLEKTGKKYSVNDLILKATAKCLAAHPEMLVSFDGSQIIHRAHVNLGMAVALDTGLIVPVIRDADKLSLDELAACAKDLAARAKDGGLTPDDYKGSTFTVSNLGMFGIEMFTPIVNQPDAAILGVTAVEDELVMEADGTISKHQVMRLCCTFDHRAMDGAVEARFGMALRDLLQSPVEILL